MTKFISYIKRIFHLCLFGKKIEEKEVEKRTNTSQPTDNSDSLSITYINWDFIHHLQSYDIVLVRMREEDIEKNKLSEAHQNRPFLLIEKDNEKQFAHGFYFTSNINNSYFQKERQGLRLILSQQRYQIHKNSLVLFQELIPLPYENISHRIDHLQENDLRKLEKYQSLWQGKAVISNPTHPILEIGDIVLFQNVSYLIYQIDSTNAYAYPIFLSKVKVDLTQNFDYFKFANRLYFIQFTNPKIFCNTDDIMIIGRWDEESVSLIRENKKKQKIQKKKKKVKKR